MLSHHTIRKKEEEKKEQSRELHDDIRGGLPIQLPKPRPTGLNLSGATRKPSFPTVIARYVFLEIVYFQQVL